MSGNSFGDLFKVTSFGESHGVALGCIIDGCPAGMSLCEADIQPALNRRRPGTSAYTTQRKEADQVELLSGVFEGKTTGTPIALLVRNQDQRSQDYDAVKDVFRPGHADWSYQKKYGIRDYRGGGRASARETVMRVAAGAIAARYLEQYYGITCFAYVDQIGSIRARTVDEAARDTNPFQFVDPEQLPQLEDLFAQLKAEGDSIGSVISVQIRGVPAGLGAPVFQKLDADLAHALMGINAVKAVSIGAGFDLVEQRGSESRDPLLKDGFQTNYAGGILGGISTGQTITARAAFKATSSVAQSIQTLNTQGEPTSVVVQGRHDPCVSLRAVPIVEAMAALVVMDHLLKQRAQNPEQLQQACAL